MLTNLNFLQRGQMFPPQSEIERLQKYEKNRLIFEGKHEQVYADSFRRIKRVINNFDEVVSYSVLANYQKLLSLKIADFLLGEEPRILCGNDNSKQQLTIEAIKNNSDLINTLYSSAIDLSRYGDSVLNVYKDEEGKSVIDITQPSFYFKVVNPRNIKKITNHILAYTYDIEETSKSFLGSSTKKAKNLYIQIHYKGYYEELVLRLDERGYITNTVQEPIKVKTGLKDFAIVPIHSLLTSDRAFGIDDYEDIDSIISEIEVRISQISKILDKHAEPSMTGPDTALKYNEALQSYELETGNYFVANKDDGEVKYITWEAQLEANFRQIEMLINILSSVSEMGSAMLDNNQKQGQIASGTALRRMMISPLAKVNRVRMRFDSAIKKALKLASQLENGLVDLTNEPIQIIWHDGLPSDPKEEAELMSIRTGGKSTLSQWSAIQRLDNLSDEDTQKELDAILQDEKENNPLSNMNFDYGKEEDNSEKVVDEE